ncbi:MAG: MerR family transcriptional regulator [Deltaproteobacteria bacterium]
MYYRINELARLAGVSVRTLRYYDEVGLLIPKRSEAGYRLYEEAELKKLQQILFWRELDFPLEKIKGLVSEPGLDRRQALQTQITLLKEKAEHFQRLTRLAQDTLDSEKGVKKMNNEDLFTAFNYEQMMEDQKQYEEEVRERWGNTDAYRISRERAARYSKEDWERINNVQMENLRDLARLYRSGVAHDHPDVLEVVARNLKFINDNFYPCSLEVLSGLGQMYVSDERFTAFYDRVATGLAAFYNEAIQHYCILNA